MDTIIRKINENEIDMEAIQTAGEILLSGGLVAFPTETVYGLGANALNEEAARKTYAAKGRPSDNPLIVHIAKAEALEGIVKEVPKEAHLLAEAFWPGPLTMIFQKNEKVPYGTTGGLDTVAVRMPEHPIALALIQAGGGYVSAPSANTSGRPSPTCASHVEEDLSGKIEMIVDGGNVSIGVESTIVDMTVSPPMILRPGAVTKDMLEDVIGEVVMDRGLMKAQEGEAPKAPGMKYRHYAPKARLAIVEGTVEEEVKAIRQLVHEQEKSGKRTGIIASNETARFYTKGIVKNIGTRENELSVAKNLYRVLREFDEEDVDCIYSESFFVGGIGDAVMNRLEKAAAHQYIKAEEIVPLQQFRRVIFVSQSDNTRGPMAAELLRKSGLSKEYEIDSRGLVVLFPEPVNQKAEAIMCSQQMTMAAHETTLFTEEDLDDDTLVLTMEEGQKWKIVAEYKFVKHVYSLGEYIETEEEVLSPYGKSLPEYGKTFEKLRDMVRRLAEKLNENDDAQQTIQQYL